MSRTTPSSTSTAMPQVASHKGQVRYAMLMTQDSTFERVSSKAIWEDQVGYCRALRAGGLVFVTGTAPVDDSGAGVHAPGDAYAQARRCLELIERALGGFGLDRRRIARTRMFVTDIAR